MGGTHDSGVLCDGFLVLLKVTLEHVFLLLHLLLERLIKIFVAFEETLPDLLVLAHNYI